MRKVASTARYFLYRVFAISDDEFEFLILGDPIGGPVNPMFEVDLQRAPTTTSWNVVHVPPGSENEGAQPDVDQP